MKDRPNLLFLMSDEHRADVTGYEGNSIIHTPVLDELARTGVVFNNAYAPSPICIPVRQCMMSGKLPRTCGCEWYGQDLPPNSMTFARRFAENGYNTTVSGKLHHMGTDQMQGWTERPFGDLHVGAQYIGNKNQDMFSAMMGKSKAPPGTGKWSDAVEIQRAGVANGPNVTQDQFATDAAIRYINNYFLDSYFDRPRYHQPLMLKLSLIQPHYPYFADEEKFNYYLNRVEPYLEDETFPHPFLSQRRVQPGVDANERELRRATAAYYAMVEKIDDHYGSTLDALEYVGQNLDDWIIVYVSDHGEMLGEHGIWEKQKFFEASARVPMIIRWPNGFEGGRVIDQNVNLCDLFATLCDLCDLPVPDGLDSRSLVPLLMGEEDAVANWNNETVSQFGDMNLMIKRDHLKYQYYGVSERFKDMKFPGAPKMPTEASEVLFDLERDPGERNNFIDDPAYAEAVAAFRVRCGELGHGPNADPNYVNAGY